MTFHTEQVDLPVKVFVCRPAGEVPSSHMGRAIRLSPLIPPIECWNTPIFSNRAWRGAFKSYDMIYLLTAIGLPPGGSSTVHIYTQTIHRSTQNKQYI